MAYKERDFVVDLITGKMVTKTDKKTGKKITDFIASKPNVNPTLAQLAAKNPTLTMDDILIMERLRCKRVHLNPTINQKDAIEKEDLKYHKKAHKARLYSLGVDPKKQMNA